MVTKKNIQQDQQQSSTPSLFNVLFYTLFLPLTIVLLYAKNFTPEALASLQRPQSFQAKVSPQSQSQAQNQSQFQGQATQPQPQTRAKLEEMRSRDEPALKSSAKDRPDTGTSTVSSQMSSTRQLYDSMTERPQDTTFTRASDTSRQAIDAKIEVLRTRVDQNPNDVKSLVELANNLQNRNNHFAESGIDNNEVFWCYEHALMLMREHLKNVRAMPTTNIIIEKEAETTMCSILTYYGSSYHASDMIDESVDVLNEADTYECLIRDRLILLSRRSESYLLLGKYPEAGKDMKTIYDIDVDEFLSHTTKHLNILMVADSDAFPGGWEACISLIYEHLPIKTKQFETAPLVKDREVIALSLQKIHLLLFSYFEKQGETESAWKHLELSQKFKSVYTDLRWGEEFDALEEAKGIFNPNFLLQMKGSGIQSRVPIFLVGFPRSGTTLLERVLDAHPQIAGLGEASALSAKLNSIRQGLGTSSSWEAVHQSIGTSANTVLNDMQLRWTRIIESRKRKGEDVDPRKEIPLRIVDKLNTNHRVVGIIHLLFPDALILHCARNPMDAVFSSYKHDFNVLDHGKIRNVDSFSTMEGVSKMYESFREFMGHYDKVMPGRVMHVRYEELVDDLEGVARAVIDAAGLEWYDDILDFHNKKQTVNTFSSTQVRKKINKSGIDSWKKYESQLQPLREMLGKYVTYDLTTSKYTRKP